VKLTYFTFSAAPDHLKDLDAIIKAFNKEHPNITIDVQTAAYADYFTKLQTSVAGGTAPDTFELNYENFVTYASAGSLLDLTAPSSADAEFDASAYYPKAYGVFQQDAKQYGLPESFSDSCSSTTRTCSMPRASRTRRLTGPGTTSSRTRRS